MHPLVAKKFVLRVDEQGGYLLLLILTGFLAKSSKAPMKRYKNK